MKIRTFMFSDFEYVRKVTMVSTTASEKPEMFPNRIQKVHHSGNYSTIEPCTLDECFTIFSHCYPFRAYFYTSDDIKEANVHLPENIQLIKITSAIYNGDYRTNDTSNACVFVVLLQVHRPGSDPGLRMLSRLPHWGEHGRNHIIAVTKGLEYIDLNAFRGNHKALLATHAWQGSHGNDGYRQSFDIYIPLLSIPGNVPTDNNFPSLSMKKYFLLYPDLDRRKWKGANFKDFMDQLNSLQRAHDRKTFPMHSYTVTGYEEMLKTLHLLQSNTSSHDLNLILDSDIIRLMSQSHFVVILSSLLDSNQFHFLLKEAFKETTIPIIIGGPSRLPLDDLIEWKRVSITWSVQR